MREQVRGSKDSLKSPEYLRMQDTAKVAFPVGEEDKLLNKQC